MAQLNAPRSSNVNVLGESELQQVVGGCCHRRRYNYGSKHCGGWRKPEYHNEQAYEAASAEESGSYEESYEITSADGKQVVSVSVSVDISQRQG
ncbi:MAG: hypothetical protein RL685_1048 [Pseudomonadota bacterium]|jgi:hypothetical protein